MIIANKYNADASKGVHIEFNFGNGTAPYRVKSYEMDIDWRFSDYDDAMRYYQSIEP